MFCVLALSLEHSVYLAGLPLHSAEQLSLILCNAVYYIDDWHKYCLDMLGNLRVHDNAQKQLLNGLQARMDLNVKLDICAELFKFACKAL